MPLNKYTTRTFHRTLYAGILETVTLLKRGDDQKQGTVTSYRLFECRWSMIHNSGEPIQGSMSSDHRRSLHIPRIMMESIGVQYFNAADRFIDKQGRYWQPESTTEMTVKLFENHYCVDCLRVK